MSVKHILFLSTDKTVQPKMRSLLHNLIGAYAKVYGYDDFDRFKQGIKQLPFVNAVIVGDLEVESTEIPNFISVRFPSTPVFFITEKNSTRFNARYFLLSGGIYRSILTSDRNQALLVYDLAQRQCINSSGLC